jgi:hypothetical protein
MYKHTIYPNKPPKKGQCQIAADTLLNEKGGLPEQGELINHHRRNKRQRPDIDLRKTSIVACFSKFKPSYVDISLHRWSTQHPYEPDGGMV